MHTFLHLSGSLWVESFRKPIHQLRKSTYEVPVRIRRVCAHCRHGLDFSRSDQTAQEVSSPQTERLCAHQDRRGYPFDPRLGYLQRYQVLPEVPQSRQYLQALW